MLSDPSDFCAYGGDVADVGGYLSWSVLFAWLALRYDWIIGLTAALVVLPILPVLAGFRIYPQGDIVHDRYLYLPSVGLCILIGLVVSKLWSTSRLARTDRAYHFQRRLGGNVFLPDFCATKVLQG
jgi:hypothetical protein